MKKVMTLGKSSESKFLGVCSGLAEHYSADVSLIRFIAVVMAFSTIGILPYLICWAVLPKHPDDIVKKPENP